MRVAAAHWSGLAEQWEDAFVFIAERTPFPGGVLWEGTGAAAAVSRTTADRQVVSGIATQLYAAARTAREGAEDVDGARQLALETVEAARAAGFTVREDLSVVAPRGSGLLNDASLQSTARQWALDIRSRAEELVAVDAEVGAGITAALSGLGAAQFGSEPVAPPQGASRSGIQAVDHRVVKESPFPAPGTDPSMGGTPHPVSRLGLPNYAAESLPDEEARRVYAEGKLRIIDQDETLARQGVGLQERAQVASASRNALRSWIRDIMANREGAQVLRQTEPNMTWDEVVSKYHGQGLTGDDLYNKIIKKSVGSRAEVDAAFGVDPKNPGGLPPIRASAPVNLPPGQPPESVAGPPAPPVSAPAEHGSAFPDWGTYISPDQIDPDAGDEIANLEKVLEQFRPKPPPTA